MVILEVDVKPLQVEWSSIYISNMARDIMELGSSRNMSGKKEREAIVGYPKRVYTPRYAFMNLA